MTLIMTMLSALHVSPPPVVYTPPAICAFMDPSDWEACQIPESWDEFCFSVTSYWVFDTDGNVIHGTLNSDTDPTSTAVGVRITSPEQRNTWVALPLPLISGGYYSYACFHGFGCLPGWDTFGAPTYQAGGFWHPSYHAKVIGVDVFTDEILHELICNDEDNPSRIKLDIYYNAQLTNP